MNPMDLTRLEFWFGVSLGVMLAAFVMAAWLYYYRDRKKK